MISVNGIVPLSQKHINLSNKNNKTPLLLINGKDDKINHETDVKYSFKLFEKYKMKYQFIMQNKTQDQLSSFNQKPIFNFLI